MKRANNFSNETKNSGPLMNPYNKLLIKCDDDESPMHPHCPHGPTLLFYQKNDEMDQASAYYSCAAYRDKGTCNTRLLVTDITPKQLKRRYNFSLEEYRNIRKKIVFQVNSDKMQCYFCYDCNMPLLNAKDRKDHGSHAVSPVLSKEFIQDPTKILHPLDNDKAEAQYFFDEKALKFFAQTFQDFRISKVICMGAPRLHTFLRKHCTNVQSFLLDIDRRFAYFFDDHEYALFNMCNNHFFDEQQKVHFCEFLKCDADTRVLIFTDPPFACRTEPITNTLHKLTNLHNKINKRPHEPLPIFWIFPYYSAHYIQEQMPELEMCDYKINYTNHLSYTDVGSKSRKLGSPVRVFTNLPLAQMKLPIIEDYKYCTACERYTALQNRHCNKCGICPSKNGASYKHCEECGACVKSYYIHCTNCRRCTQSANHNCVEYQAHQHCRICRQLGHIEVNCTKWLSYAKLKHLKLTSDMRTPGNSPKPIVCMICQERGHNELKCKQRNQHIEETTFLSELQLHFKTN